MRIFKPAPIQRKELMWTIILSTLFPLPMLVIFWGLNDSITVTYVSNFLLFFFLSIGNSFITNSITISWIEEPGKRFIYTLILTIVYTIIAAAFVVILVSFAFYGQGPIRALRNMGSFYYLIVLAITFVIGLFQFGRGFLQNWRLSEIRAAKLEAAHMAAQFESLQNQVNPHFLFNSLNVLSTLVYRDQDLATKFIKQLSKVYRYVLEAKNKEVVSLETELKALEAYIFLVKIRFGTGFIFDNQLPTHSKGHLAPLSLQMLVENAVKHNIADKNHPLVVKLYEENGRVIVHNNLQLKRKLQHSVGIGLINIKKRYQYLSDVPVTIDETNHYFKVGLPIVQVEVPSKTFA